MRMPCKTPDDVFGGIFLGDALFVKKLTGKSQLGRRTAKEDADDQKQLRQAG